MTARTDRTRGTRRRGIREAGFTLFEVMAAVLVLGVLYTVLAGSHMQGLRSEGESRRRLEASLLVDELMMELEAAIAAGESPPIGTSESEIDEYRVVTEVTPFDPGAFLGVVGGEDGEGVAPEQLGSTLLLPPEDPEESVLRIVNVAVRWMEAEGEHEVRRTTLTYDAAAVAGLFPEPGGEGDGEIDEDDLANPDGSPNVQKVIELLEGAGGGRSP